MLFCDKKWAKGFLGQDGNRLAAGRSLLQGLASTPRRRGVPFTRVCRRGLRSMSGHPAYAWGNPPTLRRSSFPQRASRPAGGPIPKHAWGCAPRPPNAKLRLDTNDAKASSVRRRRYAPKVPAAHFYVEIVDRVPLPRCGEGGRGKGQMLPQATFGAHLCAVRICFSRLLREKQYSYPAQLSVKGVCQGGSPVPLDRILVPFVRTKGTPRRRAVQTVTLR